MSATSHEVLLVLAAKHLVPYERVQQKVDQLSILAEQSENWNDQEFTAQLKKMRGRGQYQAAAVTWLAYIAKRECLTTFEAEDLLIALIAGES